MEEAGIVVPQDGGSWEIYFNGASLVKQNIARVFCSMHRDGFHTEYQISFMDMQSFSLVKNLKLYEFYNIRYFTVGLGEKELNFVRLSRALVYHLDKQPRIVIRWSFFQEEGKNSTSDLAVLYDKRNDYYSYLTHYAAEHGLIRTDIDEMNDFLLLIEKDDVVYDVIQNCLEVITNFDSDWQAGKIKADY